MFRISRTLSRLPRTAPVTRRLIATHAAKSTLARSAGSLINNKAVTLTTLGACLVAGGYMSSTVYAESSYAGTVEDPATNLAFPIYLNTDNVWKKLIGLGVRAVTFLGMNVYVVGMYMTSEDIGKLKKLDKFKKFDKEKFLADTEMAEEFLNQPYDVSIRLVPVRATNTQHLRDGFLRLLMQRMKDQTDLTEAEEKEILMAIQEFKANFVSMRVKKDTEFVFTKTKEGGLKMSYEGKSLGTVANPWLARNFFMSYLDPQKPSSEAALYDIANGIEKLMKE